MNFTHLLFAATFCVLVVFATQTLLAVEQTVVEIRTIAGMRYDPPRFVVAPGAKVKIEVTNEDEMPHNMIITAPGGRMDVVRAAMIMPITPTAEFVPTSDKVLHAIATIAPGKSAEMSFAAPDEEGVYPYVCTYPGHGFIMYGAMYVSKDTAAALPPLSKDENMPPTAVAPVASGTRPAGPLKLHAYDPVRPYLYRMFMRDSGPASIAIALPGDQNYCWDAGACRLRYAWKGAFLDPSPHWAANGDAFAEVLGRIYFRATTQFPLRIRTSTGKPVVKFRGYRLVERFPEFHYEVDGADVHELIRPLHHGGLESTFSISNAAGPISYLADPSGGAMFTSTAGAFKEGVLTLDPAAAAKFSVTLTEVPGHEPLKYWSMNDTLAGKKCVQAEDGVKGRSIEFDSGKKHEHDTGLTTDALAGGGTIAGWAKLHKLKGNSTLSGATTEPAPADTGRVLIGAAVGADHFVLGSDLDGVPGLAMSGIVSGTKAEIAAHRQADTNWHHLAVTFTPASGFTLYIDGIAVGTAAGRLPAGAPIFFASVGGKRHTSCQLDEVIIDDRAYSAAEINTLFERERAPSEKGGAQ